MASLKGWREIPIGGMILEAGNSVAYRTGDWRAFRPVAGEAECAHCFTCWVYCPDSSILVNPENEKMVGFDLEHCKGCGQCKIKDLVALSKAYHMPVSVATGGTLARKIVVDRRPEVIIAVACERDLTSGIQDSYPIPVFGIFNRRPHGPCYDTDVDLELVKKGIVTFLDRDAIDTEEPGTDGAKPPGS